MHAHLIETMRYGNDLECYKQGLAIQEGKAMPLGVSRAWAAATDPELGRDVHSFWLKTELMAAGQEITDQWVHDGAKAFTNRLHHDAPAKMADMEAVVRSMPKLNTEPQTRGVKRALGRASTLLFGLPHN
jgi:hypothetical protein